MIASSRYLAAGLLGLGVLGLGTVVPTALVSVPDGLAWTQWGGPGRNFMVETDALATSWADDGPRRLWERPLGEGHSTILHEDGRLYTMYRPIGDAGSTEEEVIVALDAASGKEMWEHRYPSPLDDTNFEHGAGPHSTPLVVGDRLFAAGSRRELMALDKHTGRVLWSHDLMADFGAPPPDRGFAPSPVAYGETIILPVGGPDQFLMAFDQQTGEVVWHQHNFSFAPGSPMLIDVDGQPQLVQASGEEIVGVDPATGDLRWSHPHRTNFGLNISTPVWGDDNILLFSSAYDGGSRAIRLTQRQGETSVEELWFSNQMRVHIGTVIRVGDYAYGSSGDFGPAFITAIHVKTGEIAWRDRAFARSTFLYADDKLVILDEDGALAMATVSPEGLHVLARADVMTERAWTVPTLVGTTLYVRNRQHLAAFDVG